MTPAPPRGQPSEFDPAWVGRARLPRDPERERQAVAGTTVLVTGAGGSIGTALCRRLLDAGVGTLVALEATEGHLHALLLELETHPGASRVRPALGDAGSAAQLRGLLDRDAASIVVHTAAFKHVPLLEEQPLAAIANNALATQRLLELVDQHGCERFVQVSTDKAAAPRSVMGASKRVAELTVLGWEGSVTASAVRLGNVWGSRGSVVPLLRERLANGQPLELTDPEARRFFLSHDEAVDAILSSLWHGRGNDLLVPELGRPLSIREVARLVLGDVPFEVKGLRPGEARDEVLLGTSDVVEEGGASWLRRVVGPRPSPTALARALESLSEVVERGDPEAARAALFDAIVMLEACPSEGVDTRAGTHQAARG